MLSNRSVAAGPSSPMALHVKMSRIFTFYKESIKIKTFSNFLVTFFFPQSYENMRGMTTVVVVPVGATVVVLSPLFPPRGTMASTLLMGI